MKRKTLLFLGVGLIVVVCILIGILFLGREKHDEEFLSRNEWAKLLCESFGLVVTEDDAVYYKDVPTTDPYHGYINTLYRASILSKDKLYRGQDSIEKEDAIQMIRILLHETGSLDGKHQETYIYSDELPGEKYLSESTAIELILKFQELYFTPAWWGEDYINITYAEDITILEDVTYIDDSYNIIQVPDGTYSAGMKILFKDRFDECMVARRVDFYGETNDGKTELRLSEIALEDAIVECDIKQTKTWGFQELYDYYKKHDMIISEQIASIDEEKMQCSDDEILNMKGFSLTFGDNSSESQFSQKSTEIEIKDLGTGNSFKVSIPTANSMGDLKFSIALTDIKVRVASKLGLLYRYVLCDVSMTPVVKLSSTKGVEYEGEIPLIPNLPGAIVVPISLDLSLEMHAEGSLSLEASTPLQFGGEVSSETGLRIITSDTVNPELKISASGEVGFSLGPKLSVGLFVPKSAFSISAPIGADLEVTNLTTHDKGERCLDFIDKHTRLSIKIAPAKVLDKVLEDKLGGSFSASLQVFGENPAPIFRSLSKRFYSEKPIHAELIGDSLRLVDKCSFIGKPIESVSQEESEEASEPQISQEPSQSESELPELSSEVVEVTAIEDTYAVLEPS